LADSAHSRAAERDGEGSRLSVVIVTHDSAAELPRTLPALLGELREGDELIVCDNGSSDGTPDLVRGLAPAATLLEGANVGFGAGVNLAAARARNELLLILNPDNVVQPGFRDAIELPLREGRGWDAWQGLVTDEGGAVLNSVGGAVHFTGIAWAGGAGRPRSLAPAEPREVPFPSGACLAIRRDVFAAMGGFSEPYFLYHEDTDLGLRLWLAGHRSGIEPRAVCDHAYEFAKGGHKWRYLERNRWATIVRVYPARLLLAVLPALLATELALLPVAALGGWLGEKLRANLELLRWLPLLLRERRVIQSGARIGARELADHCLTAELDSEYLGRAGRSRVLRALLRGYWRLARLLL
jgi:GT2 family glycosyltransferase